MLEKEVFASYFVLMFCKLALLKAVIKISLALLEIIFKKVLVLIKVILKDELVLLEVALMQVVYLPPEGCALPLSHPP